MLNDMIERLALLVLSSPLAHSVGVGGDPARRVGAASAFCQRAKNFGDTEVDHVGPVGPAGSLGIRTGSRRRMRA